MCGGASRTGGLKVDIDAVPAVPAGVEAPAAVVTTLARLPYAFAMLPSVACSPAFLICLAFLPYFLSQILKAH
jgi:hypothetical protein